jgi:hypothetical protein
MLPNIEQSDLIACARAALTDVCSKQLGTMLHAPQIETDFTGSFVKNGISALDTEFNRVLNRHSISVGIRSVYMHQSPMVLILGSSPRPMRTRKCELGDVLLVQSHRRNRWKTYWRAVLWQLKADDGTQQTAQDPQFWLYDKWPLFEVYRGGLESESRDFSKDYRSGFYGLVCRSSWLVCPPSTKIGPATAGVVDAGQFIVEMMYAVDPAQPRRNSNRGRRVFTRPKPGPPLNWSHTIWELLNITGAKEFNAKRLYSYPQNRLSLMYSSGLVGASGSFRPPELTHSEGEPDRGLLVLHISVDAADFVPREEAVQPH